MDNTTETLTELPASLEEFGRRVIGAPDDAANSMQVVIDERIKDLLSNMGGKETQKAIIEPLLHLLQQKVEVEGVRASIGEALSQIVLTSASTFEDGELRTAAIQIAIHLFRHPDQVAVAWICSFVLQLYKEIDEILAASKTAATLGVSLYLSSSSLVDNPLTRVGLESVVELARKNPDLLGSAGELASHILSVEDTKEKLLELFKDLVVEAVDDPIQLVIDAGGLIAGVLHVFADGLQSGRVEIRNAVKQMSSDPMGVGEVMGAMGAVIVVQGVFLFFGPEDLILVAGREVGSVLQFTGDVARLTSELRAARLPKAPPAGGIAFDIDALRDLAHALIVSAGARVDYKVSARAFKALRDSKILTPAFRKLLREKLPALLEKGAIENFRRMAPYGVLVKANEAIHKELFILHVLELDAALPEGERIFTPTMRAASSMSLRREWYEAAHIVDKRLLEKVPSWRDDFALLGWTDIDAMPALNTASAEHTMSIRRALIRLSKSKGMELPLTRNDIAADYISITDTMNRSIVIKGVGANWKAFKDEAKLFIDPSNPGKLSVALSAILEVWQGPKLKGSLTPEAEEMLVKAIAKLRQNAK